MNNSLKFKISNNNRSLILGEHTVIMGIINCTPDSFSGDGVYRNTSGAVNKALQMIEDGAEMIDIGGESTRPGSDFVSREEELERILPVIEGIRKESDVWISVDTWKSDVAEEAVNAGADIINDISGLLFDEKMIHTALKCDVPVIVMHIKGEP
ncbi:MAG: dihydropteroate synthase, partial [bacterium]|nr:dihydropteroate synthase [bacterium]